MLVKINRVPLRVKSPRVAEQVEFGRHVDAKR